MASSACLPGSSSCLKNCRVRPLRYELHAKPLITVAASGLSTVAANLNRLVLLTNRLFWSRVDFLIDVSLMNVVSAVLTTAYTADRSEGASTSSAQAACLYIHYGVCAFFLCSGVVYPVLCFLRIGGCRNSWFVLRRGLAVDGCAFYLAIFLLWCFGEEHYPPGDAPLVVALLGRPTIALLQAAAFGPAVRQRIGAFAVDMGLFHVKLSLSELQRDEIRNVLGRGGYGAPVASGNAESVASSIHKVPHEILGDPWADDSTCTSTASELMRPPSSHHTAKLDGATRAMYKPP